MKSITCREIAQLDLDDLVTLETGPLPFHTFAASQMVVNALNNQTAVLQEILVALKPDPSA